MCVQCEQSWVCRAISGTGHFLLHTLHTDQFICSLGKGSAHFTQTHLSHQMPVISGETLPSAWDTNESIHLHLAWNYTCTLLLSIILFPLWPHEMSAVGQDLVHVELLELQAPRLWQQHGLSRQLCKQWHQLLEHSVQRPRPPQRPTNWFLGYLTMVYRHNIIQRQMTGWLEMISKNNSLACLQNREKQLLDSSCLSVCPSIGIELGSHLTD